MSESGILVSSNLKKSATKSILSILLFVFVYLLLMFGSILFTIICTIGGIALIGVYPGFITIMIGAGLISMGILLLIFLLKFLFKRHKIDMSHLIEVTENQEPKLFGLISGIVSEVKTDFPKRVYISPEVNAGVFYESTFWSMFFPVKKNLEIGLGLMASCTESEFKAILAHEFGHFSQGTMKIGSYVYNVNKILYNLLNDNESYDSLARKWASINGYFSIFVNIAYNMVKGVQDVLKMIYNVLNINYLGLSREMEFHADEVAAATVGSKPLETALLRLDMASYSYDLVLNYYTSKISENIITSNIYDQQLFAMNFLAKQNKIMISNNLPILPVSHFSKFNKSKLVINNQWSSHPTTLERVDAISKLNKPTKDLEDNMAIAILDSTNGMPEKITKKLFSLVKYENQTTSINNSTFEKQFIAEYEESTFHKLYNGYYDDHNPVLIDLKKTVTDEVVSDFKELFDEKIIECLYNFISLERDVSTIKQIAKGEINIKTFDYDGQKYNKNNVKDLIRELTNLTKKFKDQIVDNDERIFNYFKYKAHLENKMNEYIEKYEQFIDFDKSYSVRNDLYLKIIGSLDFIHQTTPFETIELNFKYLIKDELSLKREIEIILKDPLFEKSLDEYSKAKLEKYISDNWVYFRNESYLESSLKLLFEALSIYQFVLSRSYFRLKKDFLSFQADLVSV